MINGSVQVIAGIPGINLDPFLLADSQNSDSTGYIMIAYQQQSGTFDLLFLNGASVVDCARINPDLRFPINLAMTKAMFLHNRESSSVFLYRCPPAQVEMFLATFHSEPCLKVHVNALSRKQVRSLIHATGCRSGIIERNNFSEVPPQIELTELAFPGPLPRFKTGFKHGRLLLYDLRKNRDLVNQRPQFAEGPSFGLRPRQRKTGIRVIPPPPQVNAHDESDPAPIDDTKSPPLPPDHGKELEDFDDLIKKILTTPLSTDQTIRSKSGNGRKPRKNAIITTKADAETAGDPADAPPEATTGLTSPVGTQPEGTMAEEPPPPSSSNGAAISFDAQRNSPDSIPVADGNYIRQFQRLFRSFRQQAFECFGPKCESVAGEAERQVRFLAPEFDLNNLTPDTAPSVLDVIEAMIERAPFLKRSRLRTAALTLVADLYNKNYDLLEQYAAIDKVEQHYYRLKK